MMKDWECMTDLLLEEPGPHEDPLDNRQETSLIEIMVCCIKQAATGEAPVGRGPTRRVSSLREMKQAGEDKQKLTEHFIVHLPPLLDKYTADPEKLANLLSIPQYFDLDLYTSGRQEGSLQSLLAKLKHIAQVHHEPEVSLIKHRVLWRRTVSCQNFWVSLAFVEELTGRHCCQICFDGQMLGFL